MRSARYAFNHPEVMYLSRRHQITLTLAANEKAALDELGRQFDKGAEGTVRTGETKYAPVMIATLRGKDLKIEPPDGKEQIVLLDVKGPTEWTWFVEPLETGSGKLVVLQLAARFDRRNEDMPPLTIKTFEARINVDVRVWDSVLIHARRMTPIAQVLTGAGGLIAVIGFIGTTRRWLRRKAGEQPPAPAVAEKQETQRNAATSRASVSARHPTAHVGGGYRTYTIAATTSAEASRADSSGHCACRLRSAAVIAASWLAPLRRACRYATAAARHAGRLSDVGGGSGPGTAGDQSEDFGCFTAATNSRLTRSLSPAPLVRSSSVVSPALSSIVCEFLYDESWSDTGRLANSCTISVHTF